MIRRIVVIAGLLLGLLPLATNSYFVQKVQAQAGTLCAPTEGTITQRFSSGHTALDISDNAAGNYSKGKPVYACATGTVVYKGMAELATDNPNRILHAVAIKHDEQINGLYILSFYVHMGSPTQSYVTVNVGDRVRQGDLIGYQGNAGLASGVHLHWEIHTFTSPFLDRYSSWGTGCSRSDLWYEFGGGDGCGANPNPARAVNPELYTGSLSSPIRATCASSVPDTTAPTGGYTEPANNTFVKNSVVMRGTASDDLSGVDHVNFTALYNGAWHIVYTDNAAPYEYTWDMSGIADQGITLGYDIYDKAGNYALAPQGTRQITKDATAPTGGYTEPAAGTTVSDKVTLRGTASDNLSGVDHVNFTAFYDGSWHIVYTDDTAPYEYIWDMSGIADQTITLGYDIYDKAGNIAPAPQGTRQITKAQGLLAPTNVQEASSDQNKITLRWQDNSNNEDGFHIYRWRGEDLSWLLAGTVAANQTSFTDTTVGCGSDYAYYVVAFNSSGESSAEPWITAGTYPCPATDVRIGTVTDDTIEFQWDATGTLDGFKIYRDYANKDRSKVVIDEFIGTVGADVRSFVMTGAECEGEYLLRADPYHGSKQTTDYTYASYDMPLCAPTKLQAADVTDSSITLNWQDNSYKAQGYNIYSWNSAINNWEVLTSVAAHSTEATLTDLACGTTYYFEVKAYNNEGVSASSGWIEVKMDACSVNEQTPQPTPDLPVSTPALPPTATPTTQPTVQPTSVPTSTPVPGTPGPTPGTEPQSDQHQIFLPLLGQ